MTKLELKLTEALSALHGEVEALKKQVEATKIIDGWGPVTIHEILIEAPKLKELKGERSALEVENFIWQMDVTLSMST